MKTVYEHDNLMKIECENDLYFIDEVESFTIYKHVTKDKNLILDMLYNELLYSDTEVFLSRLYDSTFKMLLVDKLFNELKTDSDNTLIEKLNELQL